MQDIITYPKWNTNREWLDYICMKNWNCLVLVVVLFSCSSLLNGLTHLNYTLTAGQSKETVCSNIRAKLMLHDKIWNAGTKNEC